MSSKIYKIVFTDDFIASQICDQSTQKHLENVFFIQGTITHSSNFENKTQPEKMYMFTKTYKFTEIFSNSENES